MPTSNIVIPIVQPDAAHQVRPRAAAMWRAAVAVPGTRCRASNDLQPATAELPKSLVAAVAS